MEVERKTKLWLGTIYKCFDAFVPVAPTDSLKPLKWRSCNQWVGRCGLDQILSCTFLGFHPVWREGRSILRLTGRPMPQKLQESF